MIRQVGNVAVLWKCPASDYPALVADSGGHVLPQDYLGYLRKQRTYFESAIQHGVEACFATTIGIEDMRREVVKLQRPWCFDSWDQVAFNIFKEEYDHNEAAYAAGVEYRYPIERIFPVWDRQLGWMLPPDVDSAMPELTPTSTPTLTRGDHEPH